jgi:16S rRNA (adenine1518-N6/adenine1519-N6)-dimethyltransferase
MFETFETNKKLGQNFLKDAGVVDKMVNALGISEGDVVLEIGVGTGALTRKVVTHLKNDNKLVGIDVDARFVDFLEKEFSSRENVRIVKESVLDFLPNFAPDAPLKVLGSLPYYITSPILHAIVKMPVRPAVTILLIQKEVAEKILNKKSNYLSTFMQTFFDVESLGVVPSSSFDPAPKVDSTVIKLVGKSTDAPASRALPGTLKEIEEYEEFLHKGFKFPKKMLNKAFVQSELEAASVDGNLRPHNLPTEKWLDFFHVLRLN